MIHHYIVDGALEDQRPLLITQIRQYPPDFGIYLSPDGDAEQPLQKDIALLEEMQEVFKDYSNMPVPYKTAILPWVAKRFGVTGGTNPAMRALSRLWRAGLVDKFCTSFHTQSGRANYVRWYIWLWDRECDASVWRDPGSPSYSMSE